MTKIALKNGDIELDIFVALESSGLMSIYSTLFAMTAALQGTETDRVKGYHLVNSDTAESVRKTQMRFEHSLLYFSKNRLLLSNVDSETRLKLKVYHSFGQ
jgi:hypothetical protein